MGVREELAGRAGRMRAAWEASPTAGGERRAGLILLRAVLPTIPLDAMRRLRGGVNAAETCGVPAGHLMISRFWSFRFADCVLVNAYLECGEIPWNRSLHISGEWREITDAAGRPAYPPRDFEELLAALEPVSEAGGGTWRDRPPML